MLCSSSAPLIRRLRISCRSIGQSAAPKATRKSYGKVNTLQGTPLDCVLRHALTVHIGICAYTFCALMKDHVERLQLHRGSAEGVLSCPCARNIDLSSFDLVVRRSIILLQCFLHAPMRYSVVVIQVSLQDVRRVWSLA